MEWNSQFRKMGVALFVGKRFSLVAQSCLARLDSDTKHAICNGAKVLATDTRVLNSPVQVGGGAPLSFC